MSDYNLRAPQPIYLKFLIGELGRTTGMFLSWIKDSKLSVVTIAEKN